MHCRWLDFHVGCHVADTMSFHGICPTAYRVIQKCIFEPPCILNVGYHVEVKYH